MRPDAIKDQEARPSFIQTVLSVSESHRISPFGVADFTAGREFRRGDHPALKILHAMGFMLLRAYYSARAALCKEARRRRHARARFVKAQTFPQGRKPMRKGDSLYKESPRLFKAGRGAAGNRSLHSFRNDSPHSFSSGDPDRSSHSPRRSTFAGRLYTPRPAWRQEAPHAAYPARCPAQRRPREYPRYT